MVLEWRSCLVSENTFEAGQVWTLVEGPTASRPGELHFSSTTTHGATVHIYVKLPDGRFGQWVEVPGSGSNSSSTNDTDGELEERHTPEPEAPSGDSEEGEERVAGPEAP